MKKRLLTISVCILVLVTVVYLTGCEKKADAPQAEQAVETAVEGAQVPVTEQTLCPVMDQPINKELFVEYEGKKVYFCCPGCEETFAKAPEKYLEKLPQFK